MKKNNKGFTLAELLIVVAIIAVLAAIAIPVFNTQLVKAKEAADEANVRSYYAQVVTEALTDGTPYPSSYGGVTLNYNDKINWSVDNGTGKLTVTYAATKITPLSLTAEKAG